MVSAELSPNESTCKLKLTASGNPEKLKKAVGATAVESVFKTFRRTLLCGA